MTEGSLYLFKCCACVQAPVASRRLRARSGGTRATVAMLVIQPQGGQSLALAVDHDSAATSPRGMPERVSSSFSEHERVEGFYGGVAPSWPGVITRSHPDGGYDVAYDDGGRERHVGASKLTAPASILQQQQATLGRYALPVGTWVEIKVKTCRPCDDSEA